MSSSGTSYYWTIAELKILLTSFADHYNDGTFKLADAQQLVDNIGRIHPDYHRDARSCYNKLAYLARRLTAHKLDQQSFDLVNACCSGQLLIKAFAPIRSKRQSSEVTAHPDDLHQDHQHSPKRRSTIVPQQDYLSKWGTRSDLDEVPAEPVLVMPHRDATPLVEGEQQLINHHDCRLYQNLRVKLRLSRHAMEEARLAAERLRDLVALYEDQRSIRQAKSLTALESYLQRQVGNLNGADRYTNGLLMWRHRKVQDHTQDQVELTTDLDAPPAL